MSASNFPNNNDDSFNSFIVTDKDLVEGVLGRTYTQNELVPVNQVKFWRENRLLDLYTTPLPFLSIPIKPEFVSDIRDEKNNLFQCINFEQAIEQIFALWKDLLTNNPDYPNPCEVVQVVVTPMNNAATLVYPDTNSDNSFITIVQNFRLTWFVPKNSFYA